jgi:hypothetical protein
MEHRVLVAPLKGEQMQEDMAAVSVDEVWALCQAKLAGKLSSAAPAKA